MVKSCLVIHRKTSYSMTILGLWFFCLAVLVTVRNPSKCSISSLPVNLSFLTFQCRVDLWTVAQSYVFFEKLILKVCTHKLIIMLKIIMIMKQ